MELEKVFVKENAKKIVDEESPVIHATPNKDPLINFARTHVPNVFEHQYAEYISGLKPPYLSVSRGRKDENENHINGEE